MGLEALVAFGAVLAVACAAPGPTIAALVARVLGRGTAGAASFCAGLLFSDIVWLTGAVLGLAVLMETVHPLFVAIKYAGAAYLLYLAWKLWSAPAAPLAAAPAAGEGIRLFFGAIAVGSGNPKTMLFYLALLPTLLPLERLTVADYFMLVATQCVVYGAILVGYVMLAVRARRAFASARAMRTVNRVTGTVMAGAAIAVATRS
ncbi:MAG: LysE family translocator [Proteobacteria bacterium]|nr:LysE family translocator [Pseudomonadota bacterium]MBI3497317.1 LysE family translocator [Pseudomonadota bacterium]